MFWEWGSEFEGQRSEAALSVSWELRECWMVAFEEWMECADFIINMNNNGVWMRSEECVIS